MAKKRQLCTFFLEDHFFGVDVGKVQEVIPYREMTPVPLAPMVIRGLINLRGQIVAAVDLRRRLYFPDFSATSLPMNIILQSEGGTVSLLVDSIGDVLELEESIFEKPPETLRDQVRECISGTYKLENQLLLELDVDKVLDLELV